MSRNFGAGARDMIRAAEKAAAGKMSVAYAQNLLSSVKTVMKIATRGQWQSISPTIDCSIPKRCCVRSGPQLRSLM